MWKFDEADYIKRVLSPAVDAFKSDGRLPDYFVRYELPLDVSDPKVIETAITTVHSCWNKSKQNIRFNKLLSVLLSPKEQQDAKKILVDREARTALREQVEAERKKQREARFTALDESIEVIASKGYVTPKEQKTLLSQFIHDGLTEQEINARVRVPVREAGTRLPTQEGLPKTVREQIRNSLGVLGKKDLYDFLDTKRGCSKQEFDGCYRRRELEWRPKASDFNKTAAQTLLGIVKTHLLNSDLAKYDAALAYSAVEELRPVVQLAASDKRITKIEFEKLLAIAVSNGLTKAIGSEYVLTLAEEYGASVEWAVNEDTVRCANCLTQVPLKNNPEGCNVCGSELWANCPKCANRVPLSDTACIKCRFKMGDLPRVRLLVRRAQLELDDGRIEAAHDTAREAERLWGRSGDVEKILGKIETAIKEVGGLRREIDEAMAAHRLFSARRTVENLILVSPNYQGRDGRNLSDLKSEIDAGLKECNSHLARAREFERSKRLNEAVFAYQDALRIAADADEARNGLSRCPPDPCTNVRAKIYEGQVQVEWLASSAVGDIEYVVVRGERRAPVSPADGEVIARVTSTSCLDQNAQPASLVIYTVFAERGGVLSKPTSSAVVLVTREVSNLNLEAGDKLVRCSWELAVSEARVRVFRQENHPPPNAGDGRELAATGSHNLIDRDVVNGQLYYYRVVVEYRGADGQTVFTPGIVKSVRPEQPPLAISEFQITLEQNLLHVSWTPPKLGTVNFYRTFDRPGYSLGEQIPAARLATLGSPLRSESNNLAVDLAPPDQPVFYTPVTVAGDVAIVGAARRYITTEDVTRVKAQDFGKYLLLQWRWPKDCRMALVAWRADAYPMDPEDTRAITCRVSKGDYEHQGGFRVENPDRQAYYFVVFAASQVDGDYVYSSGVSAGARDLVRAGLPLFISYSISRGRWLSRKRLTITLNSEKDVRNLPDIVVMAKRGNLQPLRNNEGVVLTTLSGMSLTAGAASSHEFTLDSIRRPCYLRAFFRDEASMNSFRLIDPPPQQLRIS